MATNDPNEPVTEDGENGGLTEADIIALETNKTPYWDDEDDE